MSFAAKQVSTMVFLVMTKCVAVACSSDSQDPQLDSSGEWDLADDTAMPLDIPAHEITEYEPVSDQFCVGQERLPQFKEYDYQCDSAAGKGNCVQMPNPKSGNAYYCALCGLKGSEMVCYMINPE